MCAKFCEWPFHRLTNMAGCRMESITAQWKKQPPDLVYFTKLTAGRSCGYDSSDSPVKPGHAKDIIMIENTDQLIQAIEQMGRMQRVLESFRRDILPKNPRNFAVFAEGPLDEIRKLQVEIDNYITRLEGENANAPSTVGFHDGD